MRELLPFILTALGLILALNTYQNIRRGGARFYTLEREAMLRRATVTLALTVLLFVGAVGIMYLNQAETVTLEPSADATSITPVTLPISPDSATGIQQFPPTFTPAPTVEQMLPTPTITPRIIPAIVTGTGASGLWLRAEPSANGETLFRLQDGEILSLLEDEPVVEGGYTWVKVRRVDGEQGWVAREFLQIANP
ncbi:MAG: SH3 domain-containing protein [Anaerolineae bacterium]|nr:SH3 domain-containing protein [Anaerolineae bacterium]